MSDNPSIEIPTLEENKHLIHDLNFQFQVARLGQLALKMANLNDFMDIVVDTIMTTLDVELCKILKLLPSGDELLIIAGIGWKEGYVGTATVKANENSQAGYTLKVNKPVIVLDLASEERFRGPDLLIEHNVISGISVVIQGREGIFGIIGAHSTKKRKFSEDHQNFLLSVSYILATAIDRQKSIDEIQEREANYRELIELASDAIFISDSSRSFIQVNSKACIMTGYSKEELLTLKVEDVLVDYEPNNPSMIFKQLNIGDSIVNDRNIKRKDNTTVPVEINVKMISDNKYQGIVRDITQRKISEERLIKESKFNAFTHLSGGIAHDFNNLLNVIMGNVSLARALKIDNTELQESLKNILLATNRAANITNQLLTFSRGSKPDIVIVDIVELVNEIVNFSFYGSKIKPVIKVNTDNSCLVEADEGQISQVIQNILINADQAIVDTDGEITVKICKIEDIPGEISTNNGKLSYILIKITDNGIGIEEDHLSHIFDPFFSTKTNGKGLGLSTSYSIIRNHSGIIDISSKINEGTKVRIYIPEYIGSERPIPKTKDNVDLRNKLFGTVLVLEDDELVVLSRLQTTISRMLSTLGLEFVICSDGSQVISTYKKSLELGNKFDYVLLDLTIPGGLGGYETHKKLHEIDTQVNSILTSGYTKDEHLKNYLRDGFKAILAKPYTLQRLYKVLLQSLSGN